jgi:hypothetical protein
MLTRVLKFFKPLYNFGIKYPLTAKITFSAFSVINSITNKYYRQQPLTTGFIFRKPLFVQPSSWQLFLIRLKLTNDKLEG